jgi:hypothetical protein
MGANDNILPDYFCPRCGQQLDDVPDGCRDPVCPTDEMVAAFDRRDTVWLAEERRLIAADDRANGWPA